MDDLILTRRPLIEMSLSLSFPTMLILERELPITFQEKIRQKFPIFKDMDSATNELEIGNNGIPQVFYQKKFKNYIFISQDNKSKISLSSSNISISCLGPIDLLDFAATSSFILDSFKTAYQINYFQKLSIKSLYAFSPKNYDSMIEFDWSQIINKQYIMFLSKETDCRNFKLEITGSDEDDKLIFRKILGLGKVQKDSNSSLIISIEYLFKDIINLSDINNNILKICKKSREDYNNLITEKAQNL